MVYCAWVSCTHLERVEYYVHELAKILDELWRELSNQKGFSLETMIRRDTQTAIWQT